MRIPDLSNIPDLMPVAPGEYDLRIKSAKDVKNKDKTRDGILMIVEVLNEPNADNIFHRLWHPTEAEVENDPDKAKIMWRMMKEFLASIGAPIDGSLETSDLAGMEFTATLDLEYNDGMKRNVNVIKRVS